MRNVILIILGLTFFGAFLVWGFKYKEDERKRTISKRQRLMNILTEAKEGCRIGDTKQFSLKVWGKLFQRIPGGKYQICGEH